MADDYILNAQLLEHICRDLAGECAGLLEVHVLSADCDLGSLCSLNSSLNVGERYAQYHLAPLGLAQQRLHLLDQSLRLARRLVHLPVTGDDRLAISAIHCSNTPFNTRTMVNFACVRMDYNLNLGFICKTRGGGKAPPRDYRKEITCLPDKRYPAEPDPRGTPGKRRRRWRCGSSCLRSPASQLLQPSRRRR